MDPAIPNAQHSLNRLGLILIVLDIIEMQTSEEKYRYERTCK
jgi:hypothetical protein